MRSFLVQIFEITKSPMLRLLYSSKRSGPRKYFVENPRKYRPTWKGLICSRKFGQSSEEASKERVFVERSLIALSYKIRTRQPGCHLVTYTCAYSNWWFPVYGDADNDSRTVKTMLRTRFLHVKTSMATTACTLSYMERSIGRFFRRVKKSIEAYSNDVKEW